MQKIVRYAGLLFLSTVFLTAQVSPATGSSSSETILQAGAAKNRITPPAGSIMGNSYGLDICKGVHDDLYARTIVFDYSGKKAAFIALDVVSIPHIIFKQTRELISKSTGIPGSNIIMSATHAHAGPQMNPLFLKAAGGDGEQKSSEYLKSLPALITRSVVMANSALQPVKVFVGITEEKEVNFNRRYLMKDGSFRMNPGRMNPEAVRVTGPVDPDVYAVYFESEDQKPVALLVNFALHPAIVTGNQISADFPAIVCSLIEKVYGEDMITIYTNGTSGNINHIDVNRLTQMSGFRESARIGTIVAADVMKALSDVHRVEVSSLGITSEVVELPIPEVSQEEIEWSRRIMSQFGKPVPPAFNDVVLAWKILDQAGSRGRMGERHMYTTTVPLNRNENALLSEIQVLTLGRELALVGFPGDAFVELGLAIKQNSPYTFTIVSEQSGNGTLSYVPNRKAIPEGGYEGVSARFTPGGGEKLVETVIRVLTGMYPYRDNE